MADNHIFEEKLRSSSGLFFFLLHFLMDNQQSTTMKKVMSLAALFLGFVFIFSACSKYEEGPMISFKSKADRVEGNYIVEEVYKNGQLDEDMTEEQESYEYELNADGTGTITGSADWEGATISVDGQLEWEFNDDKTVIQMRTENPFTEEWEDWEDYTILKLEDEVMWLEHYNDDDDLIEWR